MLLLVSDCDWKFNSNSKARISLFRLMVFYCAGRNCVNSLQRNQPANYKSAIGTVNHESDLLSCEVSLGVHVLIWQINCSSLSLQFRLAISDNQWVTLLWHVCILSAYIRSSCWEERNENPYDHFRAVASLKKLWGIFCYHSIISRNWVGCCAAGATCNDRRSLLHTAGGL